MSDELHYLSATEAIAHFRARELSPVELLQAIIDRTQNFEPHINAFTEEMFDEALAGARGSREPIPRPRTRTSTVGGNSGSCQGKTCHCGKVSDRRFAGGTRQHRPRLTHTGDRPTSGSRRPDSRTHDDTGILRRGVHTLSFVGRDPQSLEPRLQPRRFIRRCGRRTRRRNYHSGNSIRYRRVDTRPGRLYRHRRPQGIVRAYRRGRPAVHGFLPWRRSDGPNC